MPTSADEAPVKTTQPADETEKVVAQLLKAISEGDPPQIARLCSPSVDWRVSWPTGASSDSVPWIRPRTTRDAVEEHFASLMRHNDPGDPPTSVDRIVVDGEEAVVLGTIRNVMSHNQAAYTAHFALHLTVTDGLITRHHVYEDSLSVWEAWCRGT